jgi:cytochrome c553
MVLCLALATNAPRLVMHKLHDKFRFRRSSCAAVWLILIALSMPTATIANDETGEQIYRDQCVRCHGKSGEGTADNYPDPLAGDKSIPQLKALIHETMPNDVETKCSAEDSEKVAAYIYDAFYSADARVRNKPARIELSRLTVRQHQNAITDLIASFRDPVEVGSEHGLRGEYYSSREQKDDALRFKRIDPEVHFDWGESTPDPEQLQQQKFYIVWEGSVLAPDSGTYEFVVRTEHATRLTINNIQTPLIDAWVKSGDNAEHHGDVRFLGGRAYAIKLEMARGQQGVGEDNKDYKKAYKPNSNTSVSLLWKRPNHTLEVVPQRNLSTTSAPEVFVLQTRFPPDDRSIGYERGTAISKAWDEATTEAAIETAGYVAERVQQLAGVDPFDAGSEPTLRKFCMQFAERAFRRPLTDEQQKLYVQRQFEAAPDLLTAVKRVVLLALKSPRFLYREIDGNVKDSYDIASRMSFGIWDTAPDDELLKAARDGKLADRDEIVRQLQRMLPDIRTQSKLRDFLLGWLKISQPRDLAKDPTAFPEFTPEVASDLRTSLELSIDDILDGSAGYKQFLLSDSMWLNGRLARVYGVKLPEDAPFARVAFESERRAGVLSHPYLLASLAYTSASSPIHRGVFVSRSVLGRVLRPPAQAVAPLPPDVHAEMSTRDRVALQTKPEACQGCHAMINPLGFTMENFDAIGRYRERDRDKPIDATGSYLTQSGEVEKFSGMKDLAEFVASSDESQTAFVKQLFHHTVKQPILAYGPNRLHELQQDFVRDEFNIQKLLVEIVATSALPTE